MKHSKRIFIGINDVSGFGFRLKKGFSTLGIKADFYSFTGHVFGFKTDKVIKYSKNSLLRKVQKIILLTKLILKYDYFMFIGPFTLLKDFADIKLFKFFEKKTMILFTGCDVRIPEKVEKYKWNTCKDCPVEYKKFVNCVIEEKKKNIRKIESIFDIVTAPFEANGYLSEPRHITVFPFDIDTFPPADSVKYKIGNPFRIFHAPSHQAYKGSRHIFAAIERLKKKYTFEFVCFQNVSFEKYLEELSRSDLIIDQMLLGCYGSVAVEGLLYDKPVVTYLREDLWDVVNEEDCPIINANPDTLYDVLDKILANPEQLYKLSGRGRKFVEKYHGERVSAEYFYNLFERYNQ
jgi:glycosyltransferase involved in cell wall biosynthesis